MPRARGGQRDGTPGKPYPNRTDLQVPKTHFTGQAYGQATQQAQAQQAVPVQAPAPPDPMQAAADHTLVLPGSPHQTARPDEPLTAGLPTGPGPGPESLAPIASPNEPDYASLSAALPLLERLASNPDATVSTRNLYRQALLASMNRGR